MSTSALDPVSPEAYFDCLTMVTRAPRSVAPLSSSELHLFAYLACALSVFQGRPVGDWGYGFTLTTSGRPFSPEVDGAERALIARRIVQRDARGLLTVYAATAHAELELLSTLSIGAREPWARTAVECALALPVGAIRHAALTAPGISEAAELRQARALMSSSDIARIHEERRTIAELVGDASDLLAPAVAWLALSLKADGMAC